MQITDLSNDALTQLLLYGDQYRSYGLNKNVLELILRFISGVELGGAQGGSAPLVIFSTILGGSSPPSYSNEVLIFLSCLLRENIRYLMTLKHLSSLMSISILDLLMMPKILHHKSASDKQGIANNRVQQLFC